MTVDAKRTRTLCPFHGAPTRKPRPWPLALGRRFRYITAQIAVARVKTIKPEEAADRVQDK
jgi:hypothetical protein